jgi:hypothetical protein
MHIFELNVKAILERIQCFGPKSIHSVLFVTMGLSEFYNKLQCFTIAKISSLKKQFRYIFLNYLANLSCIVYKAQIVVYLQVVYIWPTVSHLDQNSLQLNLMRG